MVHLKLYANEINHMKYIHPWGKHGFLQNFILQALSLILIFQVNGMQNFNFLAHSLKY